jgi:hypothetical protein
MKTVNDIPNQNIPLVAIDKSLDKLSDRVHFKEKLERANEALANAKLPVRKEFK